MDSQTGEIQKDEENHLELFSFPSLYLFLSSASSRLCVRLFSRNRQTLQAERRQVQSQ